MTTRNFKVGDLVIWNEAFQVQRNSNYKETLYKRYHTYIYQIRHCSAYNLGLALIVPGTEIPIKFHDNEPAERRWLPDCFILYNCPRCLLSSKKFIL